MDSPSLSPSRVNMLAICSVSSTPTVLPLCVESHPHRSNLLVACFKATRLFKPSETLIISVKSCQQAGSGENPKQRKRPNANLDLNGGVALPFHIYIECILLHIKEKG